MRIDLAGFGPGTFDLTTHQVWQALEEADLVITSKRLAETLWGPGGNGSGSDTVSADAGRKTAASGERIEYSVSYWNVLRDEDRFCLTPGVRFLVETRSASICRILEESDRERVLCLFGGDSSFYSGAAPLMRLIRQSRVLQEKGVTVRLLPGISSLSCALARLGLSFQETEVFSAHGRDCDPVKAVMSRKNSFFLTGGRETPDKLCAKLTAAGLGKLKVTILENLYSEGERIRTMAAEQAAGQIFDAMSVMVAQPAPVSEELRRSVPGIPDDLFVRGQVPMTKRFVRVSALSCLAPGPEEVCWDLGAGTGSVSIELSAYCRKVISVEKNPEAVSLLEENRKKFGAWNMEIVQGEIPAILEELPAPDKIFVGGGGEWIREVLRTVSGERPAVCATAITLETLQNVRCALEEAGYKTKVTQVAVTEVKKRGQVHMMDAQNPVFLIQGIQA